MPDESHFFSDTFLVVVAVVALVGAVVVFGVVLFWLVDRLGEWLNRSQGPR